MYTYLDSAEKEVFNLIMEEDEGYFQTTDETIDYASGTQEYSLPTDCIKVVLVERTDTDPVKTLSPIRMQDKLKYELVYGSRATNNDYEYYYLTGTSIGIVPKPTVSETNNLKIYYIARPATVASGSSAFTVPDSYGSHELICAKAAITAKMKGDEPIGDLGREAARLEARLKTSLQSRQTQEAQYVNYIKDSCYD